MEHWEMMAMFVKFERILEEYRDTTMDIGMAIGLLLWRESQFDGGNFTLISTIYEMKMVWQ